MREIEGLVESFKEARMVYLTTFRDGEERSRQMTNFNEDPYDVIWFPSDMKSRKVEEIKDERKVMIGSGDGGISTGTPPRRRGFGCPGASEPTREPSSTCTQSPLVL
jgi:hypothetical protein